MMATRICVLGLASLATLTVLACSGMAQTLARPLITSRIDESTLVTLQGNTRPEATVANDRGRVADATRMDHMFLLLQRAPEREEALRTVIDQLHDPKSANFHHWLTPQQFGQSYGVGQADTELIQRWLESHGFTVNQTYPNQMMVDFSGTAGQVRESFHTEMHRISVNGETHVANMSDPRIPAALAPAVKGVVSLNDFRPRTMMKRVPHGKGIGVTFGPDCGYLTGLRDASPNCEAVMPADLATIYNLNQVFSAGITGKGQTIVVIEDEDAYSLGDWSSFRKVAGLARTYPYGSVSQTHPAPPTGANNCSDPGDLNDGTDDEVAIDMEWASAAAPNAAIQVAVCKDSGSTFGGLIA